MRYNVESVINFCASILEKAGLNRHDAELAADSIVAADVRGITSHGVTRLGTYAKRLQTGVVNANVRVSIENDSPSALLVDGGNGMGSVVGIQTMDLCIERAREYGSCFAAVHRGNHFGIGSYFTMHAARQGMIGVAMSNAPASVVPTGGSKPMLGTNPLSVAIPAGRYEPLVLDMASSVVAQGKVILAAKEEPGLIPEGWAVDENGLPTTNAKDALKGAMMPFGGAKGYAIAFIIDILCSGLSGAFSSTEIRSYWNNFTEPQDVGFFMGVWDISKFLPLSTFRERMDGFIDRMKACPPAPDSVEVLIPGEIEARKTQENMGNGIEIGEGVLRDLQQLSQDYAVELF